MSVYLCLYNKHEAQASAYSILKDIFLILSPVRDRQLLLDSYSSKWPDRYESRHNSGTSFPILHFMWGPRPPLLPTCGCQSTSAIRPLGFPGGSSGKELPAKTEDIKRRVLDPWVGKIPWKRAWQPTQVFLPGESALTYSFPNFALFHVQF